VLHELAAATCVATWYMLLGCEACLCAAVVCIREQWRPGVLHRCSVQVYYIHSCLPPLPTHNNPTPTSHYCFHLSLQLALSVMDVLSSFARFGFWPDITEGLLVAAEQ
jgi:hypothetical protein